MIYTPTTEEVREVYASEWDSYHGFQWSKKLEAGDKDKFVKLSRDHGLKESDIAAQLIIHDSLERKQHDQD